MKTIDKLRQLCPTISVGVLTADLMNLEDELNLLEGTGVEILHFDVMDGCFTPMMTVGPPYVKGIRTKLLKDVHLMVTEPLEKVAAYVAAGADIITVHAESELHIHRVFQALGSMENVNDPERGLVRGVALNPGTPLSVIEPVLDEVEMITLVAINPGWGGQKLIPATFDRLHQVKELVAASGRQILTCIDGGVTRANIGEIAAHGPDLVVTGSAVFDGKAPTENGRFMLEAFRSRD
ncbi:MAG: ribulose-phosphate 3-epimerase [Acidobacteriota bacterium]|nr:MAG: ribulose-phosphate 3-epimerase [Acidobacteriota bacterium]